MRHQDFADVVLDFVPKELWQPVMLAPLGGDFRYVLVQLRVLAVLHVREHFQLSEDPVEGFPLVLLEDDPHTHVSLSSEEDYRLS